MRLPNDHMNQTGATKGSNVGLPISGMLRFAARRNGMDAFLLPIYTCSKSLQFDSSLNVLRPFFFYIGDFKFACARIEKGKITPKKAFRSPCWVPPSSVTLFYTYRERARGHGQIVHVFPLTHTHVVSRARPSARVRKLSSMSIHASLRVEPGPPPSVPIAGTGACMASSFCKPATYTRTYISSALTDARIESSR